MRFRVECTNPKTRQRHEFELDGQSLHDVQRQLHDSGLVATRVTPLSTTHTGDGASPPRPLALRWPDTAPALATVKRGAVYGTLLVVVVLGLTAAFGRPGEITAMRRLEASVRFNGDQFMITNAGDWAWHDVWFDVNGGLANRGYVLKLSTMAPYQSTAFASAALVDDDGNTFDPTAEKLAQVRIACTTADGRKALYTRRY